MKIGLVDVDRTRFPNLAISLHEKDLNVKNILNDKGYDTKWCLR